MTTVANLDARLSLEHASFESGANRAKASFSAMQRSIASDVSKINSTLASVGTSIVAFSAGFAGAILSVQALSAAVSTAYNEVSGSQRGFLQLQAVLKATGNTTGLTAKQISDLADKMEMTTFATDDMVKNAAARLATFGTISTDVFTKAIELSQDMAAIFGGDVVSAVERVGTALDDPVDGLKKLVREVRGFNPEVAETAKKLREMGDVAGSQKAIIEELTRLIGGAGEAEASGLAGAFKKAQTANENFLASLADTSGASAGVTSFFNDLSERLTQLSERVSFGGIGALFGGAGSQAEQLAQQQREYLDLIGRINTAQNTLNEATEETPFIKNLRIELPLLQEKAEALRAVFEAGQQERAAADAASEDEAKRLKIQATEAQRRRIEYEKAAAAQEEADKEAKARAKEAEAEAKRIAEIRQKAIADSARAREEAQRLNDAQKLGAEAVRKVTNEIEAENVVRAAQLDLSSKTGKALYDEALATEELTDSTAKLKKAQEDATKAREKLIDEIKKRDEKAAEDQKNAQQRAAEAAAEATIEPYRRAAERIHDEIADSIYDALNGQIKTAEDVANTLADIFKRMFSEVAAAAIFNPAAIFGGGFGGAPGAAAGSPQGVFGGFSGLFGGATLGSAFPSVFGAGTLPGIASGAGFGAGGLGAGVAPGMFPGLAGTSIGGLFAAGGLGYAGGGLLANLTGGNEQFGAIGGALGATAGYAFGGPIGGFLGGLSGSVLGSLFGGGSRRDNNFSGTFNPLTGQFNEGTNTNPDPGNVQSVKAVTDQLAALSAGLKSLGIDYGGGTIRVKAGSESGFLVGNQNFDSLRDAVAAGMEQVLSQSSGFSAIQQRVLNNTKATDATGLLKDLAVPEAIAAFMNQDTTFRKAFDQINATFKQLLSENDRLDLGKSGGLGRARQRQLNDLRIQARSELGLGDADQFDAAVAAVREQFRQAKKDADLLKVSVADLNKAEKERIDQIREQEKLAKTQEKLNVRNTLIGLGVIELTPLQQAIEAVRQQFKIARLQADELGVSVETLNQVEKDRIDTIKKEFKEQEKLVQQQQQQQLADQRNQTIGAIQSAVGGFNALLDPLAQFQTSLATNGNGPTSASSQLATIRKLFGSSVTAAQTDGATQSEVASVIDLGQKLIDASRDVNASSTQFASDFAFVNRIIAELQKDISKERDAFIESLPQELRNQTDRTVNELKQLVDLAYEQIRALNDLTSEMSSQNRRRIN